METSTTPYSIMDEFEGELSPREYAGFWIRFVAVLIDGVILAIPFWIISMIILGGAAMTMDMQDPNPFAMMAAFSSSMLLYYAIGILYKAILESSSWQGTVGKRALGLKVTNEQGQRISFARSLGRTLATYLSGFILCIGYIMAAFSSRKQALHDKIASTLVVKA